MKISSMSIHCGDSDGNKYPRVAVGKLSNSTITLEISADEGLLGNITFFLKESDLINFKNSVISAVDNYKRGNK